MNGHKMEEKFWFCNRKDKGPIRLASSPPPYTQQNKKKNMGLTVKQTEKSNKQIKRRARLQGASNACIERQLILLIPRCVPVIKTFCKLLVLGFAVKCIYFTITEHTQLANIGAFRTRRAFIAVECSEARLNQRCYTSGNGLFNKAHLKANESQNSFGEFDCQILKSLSQK